LLKIINIFQVYTSSDLPCGNAMNGKTGTSSNHPCRSCHIHMDNIGEVFSPLTNPFGKWSKEQEIFLRESIKQQELSPRQKELKLKSLGLSSNYSPLFFLDSLRPLQVRFIEIY
jgi:hypothetical protein